MKYILKTIAFVLTLALITGCIVMAIPETRLGIFDSIAENYSPAYDELAKQNEEKQKIIEKITNELIDKNTDLFIVQESLSNSNAKITDLENNIDVLDAEITELTSLKTTLENEKVELEANNDTLQSDLDELQAQLTQVESDLAQAILDKANLQIQIDTLNESVTILNTRINELEAQIETLEEQLQNVNESNLPFELISYGFTTSLYLTGSTESNYIDTFGGKTVTNAFLNTFLNGNAERFDSTCMFRIDNGILNNQDQWEKSFSFISVYALTNSSNYIDTIEHYIDINFVFNDKDGNEITREEYLSNSGNFNGQLKSFAVETFTEEELSAMGVDFWLIYEYSHPNNVSVKGIAKSITYTLKLIK